MFIITAHGCKRWVDGKKCFLAKDYGSGGYPYWSIHLKDAHLCSSVEEARECWKLHKPLLYSDIDEVDKDSIKIQEIHYKDIEKLEI